MRYIWAHADLLGLVGLMEMSQTPKEPLVRPSLPDYVHRSLERAVASMRAAIVLQDTASDVANGLYVFFEPEADLVVAVGADRSFSLTYTDGIAVWPAIHELDKQARQRLASEPLDSVLHYLGEAIGALSPARTSRDVD